MCTVCCFLLLLRKKNYEATLQQLEYLKREFIELYESVSKSRSFMNSMTSKIFTNLPKNKDYELTELILDSLAKM